MQTSEIWTLIVALIGSASGAGVVILGVVKFFGEKWLNAKFEERLAEYKHAQQKELEQLRFNINALTGMPLVCASSLAQRINSL